MFLPHVVACISSSFILLNGSIPLYRYTTFYLSTYQLMDVRIAPSFWLLRQTLLWSLMYMSSYEHMFSFHVFIIILLLFISIFGKMSIQIFCLFKKTRVFCLLTIALLRTGSGSGWQTNREPFRIRTPDTQLHCVLSVSLINLSHVEVAFFHNNLWHTYLVTSIYSVIFPSQEWKVDFPLKTTICLKLLRTWPHCSLWLTHREEYDDFLLPNPI